MCLVLHFIVFYTNHFITASYMEISLNICLKRLLFMTPIQNTIQIKSKTVFLFDIFFHVHLSYMGHMFVKYLFDNLTVYNLILYAKSVFELCWHIQVQKKKKKKKQLTFLVHETSVSMFVCHIKCRCYFKCDCVPFKRFILNTKQQTFVD